MEEPTPIQPPEKTRGHFPMICVIGVIGALWISRRAAVPQAILLCEGARTLCPAAWAIRSPSGGVLVRCSAGGHRSKIHVPRRSVSRESRTQFWARWPGR